MDNVIDYRKKVTALLSSDQLCQAMKEAATAIWHVQKTCQIIVCGGVESNSISLLLEKKDLCRSYVYVHIIYFACLCLFAKSIKVHNQIIVGNT